MEYSKEFMNIARTLDNEMGATVSIVADMIGDSTPSYSELAELQDIAFRQFIDENKERIFSRLFDFYRPIWEKFEEIGWHVERDYSIVELNNYSPAGEELVETLYLDDKGNIPQQLLILYDDFDEEEHAVMWLDEKQHGVKGVPPIWTLVKDAEEITKMYDELYTVAYDNYSLCEEA